MNNYCRNCGEKLENEYICQNCNTKVLNKRITKLDKEKEKNALNFFHISSYLYYINNNI